MTGLTHRGPAVPGSSSAGSPHAGSSYSGSTYSGPTYSGPTYSGYVKPRALSPWAVAAVTACGCAAVALVDPEQRAMSPACPFRVATGWWCPGCGATRATSRLLHGDVSAAFRYNALWALTIPVVVFAWVMWAFPQVRAAASKRMSWLTSRTGRLGSSLAWVGVYALMAAAFVVVRNSGMGYDWLRFPGA